MTVAPRYNHAGSRPFDFVTLPHESFDFAATLVRETMVFRLVSSQRKSKIARRSCAFWLLSVIALVFACDPDNENTAPESSLVAPHTAIDLATLEADGVQVRLTGSTGKLRIPLENVLQKSVSTDTLHRFLRDDVAMVVQDLDSSDSVTLSAMSFKSDIPSSPGELRATLASNRDAIEVEFFNQSIQGLSFSLDGHYQAKVTILRNDMFSSMIPTTLRVTVSQAEDATTLAQSIHTTAHLSDLRWCAPSN